MPTPSLEAADFSSAVDNAWFPLVADSRLTYADPAGRELVRTVGETDERGGVPATPVTTTPVAATWAGVAASDLPGAVTQWYAQDQRGNVWLVGGTDADGSTWEAGNGGDAGLVVTATPRAGDGYVRRDSDPPLVATVLEVGESEELAGESLETVAIQLRLGPLDPGGEQVDVVGAEVLGRGVGPVQFEDPAWSGSWTLTDLP